LIVAFADRISRVLYLLTLRAKRGSRTFLEIAVVEKRCDNAIWAYEDPVPAAAAIASHLAFYPDRVEIERKPK
jgi:uncharacterized protein (DUF427 family)